MQLCLLCGHLALLSLVSTSVKSDCIYIYWQVPIHTVAVENDQLLRGWLSCPELTKKVTAFYESKTFQEREAESASLRKTLANVLGIEKIELKDFYNV